MHTQDNNKWISISVSYAQLHTFITHSTELLAIVIHTVFNKNRLTSELMHISKHTDKVVVVVVVAEYS